jgi:hypothetical protein
VQKHAPVVILWCMKQCTKCLIFKDNSAFSKHSEYADGLSYWCRECWKQYRKKNYDNNLEGSRRYTNDKRAKRISWFQELKSNIPCVDCGQIYEPYCMDYDHILEKGQKIKHVSRMVLDHTPKEVILAEIEKCELVCLLCHNKRTHDRFDEELGIERKYPPHVQRNVNMINTFKTQPCAMCHIQYELYNMQIDHIDPTTKLYDVCQLKSCKVEKLLSELAKCQVLCALCHRRKSIIEQQDDKYSAPRAEPPKRQELFYDPITNTKECGLCHKILDGKLFRTNRKTVSGLDTYCKECFNEYRRERRRVSKQN